MTRCPNCNEKLDALSKATSSCGACQTVFDPDDVPTVDLLPPRPSNRVRVVYEGDPLCARVELSVMADDGTEHVYDIPFETMTVHIASRGRARLVLGINEQWLSVHAEGEVDDLMEQKLVGLASMPAQTFVTSDVGVSTRTKFEPMRACCASFESDPHAKPCKRHQ